MVARVRCQGTCENVSPRYDYAVFLPARAGAGFRRAKTPAEFGACGRGLPWTVVRRCVSIQDGVRSLTTTFAPGAAYASPHARAASFRCCEKSDIVVCAEKGIGRFARCSAKRMRRRPALRKAVRPIDLG